MNPDSEYIRKAYPWLAKNRVVKLHVGTEELQLNPADMQTKEIRTHGKKMAALESGLYSITSQLNPLLSPTSALPIFPMENICTHTKEEMIFIEYLTVKAGLQASPSPAASRNLLMVIWGVFWDAVRGGCFHTWDFISPNTNKIFF